MCETTLDFRCGAQFPRLVFLGACPGQEEWNAQPRRPFAGQSGQNLGVLLEVLRDLPNRNQLGFQDGDFASPDHDDYTLMNSHSEAKWSARDGRSTPRMGEVEDAENMQRLRNQLNAVNARIVIGLGRPVADERLAQRRWDSGPMRAIRLLAPYYPGVNFYVTGHPSPRAINGHAEGDAEAWLGAGLRRFPLE